MNVKSQRRLRVAVLFGGRSAEHEISILSARNVVAALDPDRFEPILVGIDKQGRWHSESAPALLGQPQDPRHVALTDGAVQTSLAPYERNQLGPALEAEGSAAVPFDVVFPVLHGPFGEDGTIQGLLALAGTPFVGAGVLASAVGMDKDVMKRLLRDAGLPIVAHQVVARRRFERDRGECIAQAAQLADVVFVKPANLGSSVGISRCKQPNEIGAALDLAFEFDDKVIIEAGLQSPREIECAVLGNEEPIASSVGEITIQHEDGFYSYNAKYVDAEGVTMRIPADLSAEQTARIQKLALQTFEVLGCEGLARVDFFCDRAGDIYVNEINTMPGFTAISMYPKLFEHAGIGARELVGRLIDLALARHDAKKRLRTSV